MDTANPDDENRCLHSYYRSSAKAIILKLVNESEIELTPRLISSTTGINHSTVRGILRFLFNQGEILQPYPGAYCNKSVHGVRFVPLRVHNVVLSVCAPWLDFTDEVVEGCGSTKIRVTFGLDRRRITGFISCDSGMDKDTALFAVNRFIDIVETRTGKPVDSLIVKTFEANRDYAGVRLDGVQCITKKGLFGVLERIYQKEDCVRHEFKISKSMSLDEFSALVQGGAASYNMQQGLFMLVQKVENLTEVMKSQNEATMFQGRVLKAMFDKQQKEGSP